MTLQYETSRYYLAKENIQTHIKNSFKAAGISSAISEPFLNIYFINELSHNTIIVHDY